MEPKEAPRETPTVAVVGASSDRRKFGNKSVRAHAAAGYRVFPVNPGERTIEGLPAYATVLDVPEALDRITVYVQPEVLAGLLPGIARKGARQLFLNPGADREDVVAMARGLGLSPILACSIVDVGFSPSEFSERAG